MLCIQTVFKLSIQGACEEDWQMALQLFTFLELPSLEANVISSLDRHRFTDGIQPVIPGILFPPTSNPRMLALVASEGLGFGIPVT